MAKKYKRVPTELGERPVGTLLWQYALPAIIAMTATSLYNIVDRAFIGHIVGKQALAGLAATFPFMNLGAAFGAMVGVGASTVISVRLGQKDYRTAQQVLGNSVMLNLILGTLFTVVFWIYLDPVLYVFGASEVTIPYARDYMKIILAFNVVGHSYLGLNNVMRAAGHPRTAMLCTLMTVVVNAILDPLFMLVLRLGIQGAAIATVISQAIALVVVSSLFCRKDELLRFKRGIYGLRLDIVRQTLSIGMAPFLLNLCACLVVLLINQGMLRYGGDDAVGAYSIVNSVVFFFLMIVIGLNQGMQPIVGYNWGARQDDRVWQCLRLALVAGTGITFAGFLICEIYPRLPSLIFTTDEHIISLASRGFRLCVSIFPLVGAQMVISNFFQSIGHAGKSIFLSVSRQMLFLIPGLLVLPRYWGLDGVWISIPIADFVSMCAATVMLWLTIRHVCKKSS